MPVRKPVARIVVFVIVAIGLIGWRLASARETGPGSTIALRGRIEGEESAICPKIAGRLLEVRVREGDRV